jgi:hypothetical protein
MKIAFVLSTYGYVCCCCLAYDQGAAGFGLGSALYKPGDSATLVAEKAAAFVAGWAASTPKL